MLLYWYACISIYTDLYMIYDISLETVWWALSNATLIMGIHPFSCSWDNSWQNSYSYWWPDISVVFCHFCTSHICVDSPHYGLSSATYFVKISLLVVEIQSWMKFVIGTWHEYFMFLGMLFQHLCQYLEH